MKRRFAHYLQKFSYTRLDDDEFLLRPFVLKVSEETAFTLVKRYIESSKSLQTNFDNIHHEIFVKYPECEVNFLFAPDDEHHTIVSITTFAKRKGISYKKLLKIKEEIRPIFKQFIESE